MFLCTHLNIAYYAQIVTTYCFDITEENTIHIKNYYKHKMSEIVS